MTGLEFMFTDEWLSLHKRLLYYCWPIGSHTWLLLLVMRWPSVMAIWMP